MLTELKQEICIQGMLQKYTHVKEWHDPNTVRHLKRRHGCIGSGPKTGM